MSQSSKTPTCRGLSAVSMQNVDVNVVEKDLTSDLNCIAVVGLWHLGSVISACIANAGFNVIAYDPAQKTVDLLNEGQPPIFEPGLNELIQQTQKSKKLHFTSSPEQLAEADLIWITFDTPVDDHDIADVDFVNHQIIELMPHFKKNAVVLISSQMPVGTTRQLLEYCQRHYPLKELTFAYSPENLRLGKAIQVFTQADRVVIGIATEKDKARLYTLFAPFTEKLVWMSLESAEMTKHALNAFFATSVVFINELATVCEQVGADASEVEQGLKSEERIGSKAYLRPGTAIGGGTLARDVNFLTQLSERYSLKTPLFSSLLQSNANHKLWACRRVQDVLLTLKGRTIGIIGLTYKVGTDTLRRSTAIDIATWLHHQGATVMAYDPAINDLPETLTDYIELKPSLIEAVSQVDALIIGNECPEFLEMTSESLSDLMKQPHVFDVGGFLKRQLAQSTKINYYHVGSKA